MQTQAERIDRISYFVNEINNKGISLSFVEKGFDVWENSTKYLSDIAIMVGNPSAYDKFEYVFAFTESGRSYVANSFEEAYGFLLGILNLHSELYPIE